LEKIFLMNAALVWNVSPEIFRFGNFAPRWYGLLFALSFYAGYLILTRAFKKEGVPIAVLDSLVLYIGIAVLIGARLGHCLMYEPGYYLKHPVDMLKIWQGGLASHGAAVGILIAIYIFSRRFKKPYLWVLDRVVIVTALAGFFIRMGNLMNSEIYGKETTLPWGVIFAQAQETVPRHPTQIYEGLAYLAIFILLYGIYRKKGSTLKDGFYSGVFLTLVFSARFLIEFVKNTQVDFEKGMFLDMGQLLSIPFIITGLVLWYLCRGYKPLPEAVKKISKKRRP
jgi:phosphatidylglycerol---prolipoprotein diacylglyceryl transferase